MPNNKIEPIKSKLYKEWVKVKLCCHCQAPADDPHHQEHADRCEKLAKRDAGESLPKLNTQGAEA